MNDLKLLLTGILLFINLPGKAQDPVANFEVIVTYECAYAVTEYKNYSTNADSFLWKPSASDEYWIKTYAPKGSNLSNARNWTVTLIAYGNGTSDTLSKQVEIEQARVEFDTIILDPERFAPLKVDFTTNYYIPEGDTIKFFWEFGDGNTSNAENPVHIYQQPGTYFVKLNISKKENCEYANTLDITVRDTAQREEFKYYTYECTPEHQCDGGKEHLIENDDLLLNTVFERNDSLFVSGIIKQNCCTKKTSTMDLAGDTVKIKLWETGPLCTCWNYFYFEINIPQTEEEEIIFTLNEYTVTSTITSNANEQFENNSLEIYPNPVKDVLNINLLKAFTEITRYKILDIQGRIIKQGLLSQKNSIILQDLNPGVYLLQIKSNNESYSNRFIKK
ncbi:MAG: T9SS type A sorting domain-containing protein [Cyclobacteriaceae bacterium]